VIFRLSAHQKPDNCNDVGDGDSNATIGTQPIKYLLLTEIIGLCGRVGS
jgi:hypothetical protein